MKTKEAVIVDDDESIRFTLTQLLYTLGYRVLATSDGLEALELILKHGGTLDLLITDQEMPNLKGIDLVHRVIEEDLSINLIILFTGLSKGDIEIRQFKKTTKSLGLDHIKVAFKGSDITELEKLL